MTRNGSVLCQHIRSEVGGGGFDDMEGSSSSEVHVLAVDDSLVDRKVIERLLKISSCKVTVVDSGIRALQFLGLDEENNSSVSFDGLKVDMIITDYCMPGMTGYELLKKIKGSSDFREIPVVIMSSENVLARIDRCLEEGAKDFIVKPVKLADVERLKDFMSGDERLSKENKGINKRKALGSLDESLLLSQPSIDSTSPSSCSSTQDISSQSYSALSSPDSSPPSSPSPLLKYTYQN